MKRICSLLAVATIVSLFVAFFALSSASAAITFSDEERAVIAASAEKPVSIGVITSTAPECYVDPETGDFAGITMDVLDRISLNTGLVFEYVPIDLANNTPVGWLKAGVYDVVAGILKTPRFLADEELVVSHALFTDSLVMLSRKGDDFTESASTRTIISASGFQVGREYVNERFPLHQHTEAITIGECMNAVRGGDADATVYLQICSSYLLQDPHYDNLQVSPLFSRDVDVCMAVLSADNAVLMCVLNKGLEMISENDLAKIMISHTVLNPYRETLGDILYEYRTPLTIIALLIILVVGALAVNLSLRVRSSKKLKKAFEQTQEALRQAEASTKRLMRQIQLTEQWQEASNTDELTGLFNRRGGSRLIKELIESGERGLFGLFDVDKFKSINDRFGHDVGDEALKAVAGCMRTFRTSDVTMRFGGDEFVLYAVGISEPGQARECVERFLAAIDAVKVEGMNGNKISVSLGLVMCDAAPGCDFDDLYRRADEAMYRCKNNPKECYRFSE